LKDILAEIDQWREAGKQVALATVVQVYGSAPRPLGAKLAVSEEGAMVGSVSGGCVESATVQEALEVLSTGEPRLVAYGIADETGLSCQGDAHSKPRFIAWAPLRVPSRLRCLYAASGPPVSSRSFIRREWLDP
jgi:xanthine/CO dehydrogenase XdhC/CoxF family maturation factor